MSSIWTVLYTKPSRYNWMFQFYLRAEGLALSWIGTGRLIFSLNYTDADFDAVADRFVAAAKAMDRDGWWWCGPHVTNKAIRRRILREVVAHKIPGSEGPPAASGREVAPGAGRAWQNLLSASPRRRRALASDGSGRPG